MKLISSFLFLAIGSIAAAQAPSTDAGPDSSTGIHVGSISVPLGAVNPTNGDLSFSIPLVSLPGRNGSGLTVSLQYDSRIWSPHLVNDTQSGVDTFVTWNYEKPSWRVGDMGWHLSLPFLQGPEAAYDEETQNLLTYGNWIVTLADGTKHTIDGGWGGWPSGVDSEDGDSIKMVGDSIAAGGEDAILADGSRIRFQNGRTSAMIDRNGNTTTIDSNGVITDSAGHQLKLLSSGSNPYDLNYTGI